MKRFFLVLWLIATMVASPIQVEAATFQQRILTSATLPDTSGNVWLEPAATTQTNDRYAQLVVRYKDTGTKDCLGGNFTVPQNYSSGPSFKIIWVTTATSGNVVWDLDYTSIASGETFDPNSDQEALTVTTGADPSAQIATTSSMNGTAGNFAAGDTVQFKACRDGASASDTMTADAVVYAILFQYTG